MLKVEGASRRIGTRDIVERVSFTLAPGEVLAVLGPSGSGKTSLLRLIAGFDAPSAGRIVLHGRTVSEGGRVLEPPERRALALAFQDATLFPQFDAIGNAAFALRTGTRAERRARAVQVLAEMGLAQMEGRDVATLSGGEAQRVSLARALAAEAKLLLLDEPFGNVDRLTRVDLVARLKAHLARAPERAAIIITHDPADAFELGTRVLLMRQAQLVADGTPAAVAAGAHGEWARSLLAGGAAPAA